MKEELIEGRRGRPVTVTTVVLAITVTALVAVVLGTGFTYYNISNRLALLEQQLEISGSEELREKRQLSVSSRGSCYVCPQGERGPAGRNGRNGLRGPRGFPGKNGKCNCNVVKKTTRTGAHKGTTPSYTTAYEDPTTKQRHIGGKTDGYVTSTALISHTTDGGYATDVITTYTDTKRGVKPTRRWKTRPIKTTAGYVTTAGYGVTTDGYMTTPRRKIVKKKGSLKGKGGYGY